MVTDIDRETLTPTRFRSFLGSLMELLDDVGRQSLKETLELLDEPRAQVERDGQSLRYRGKAKRQWLTAMGRITVARRTYRGDGRGAKSTVPLDVACGMSNRYMTPDVEQMSMFAAAMVTPRETQDLLAKTLPEAPSATAIQNAMRRNGAAISRHRKTIEDAICEQRPLSADGDTLVVSWDGVMAPLRETSKIGWREAGVATVSVYSQSADGPEKKDTRYLAQMPESGMVTLLEQVVDQVRRATDGRTFREFAIVCDGKESIWDAAASHPELRSAVWILDFYHASENLMKAAKAIFGDDEVAAHRWHGKLRKKLLHEANGADSAIRSMRRYRNGLSRSGQRAKTVDNAIKYFCFHRHRMCYVEFAEMGLPIGSGNVESAAKNIVQARLKRSGMRWSRDGGQHVLDLRTYLKSDRWEVMWDTIQGAA